MLSSRARTYGVCIVIADARSNNEFRNIPICLSVLLYLCSVVGKKKIREESRVELCRCSMEASPGPCTHSIQFEILYHNHFLASCSGRRWTSTFKQMVLTSQNIILNPFVSFDVVSIVSSCGSSLSLSPVPCWLPMKQSLPYLAYCCVHSFALAIAALVSCFQCCATSLARGSSGLGAPSSA
jgi:hypothetical protein